MEIINISNKLRDFEEHLNLNRQTIVSAKFGDGKTYFLNQYIESHKDDTFFIVLHPVNYVVSRNEDIFEYIKRDILCSLVHRTEFQEINWDEALKELLRYATVGLLLKEDIAQQIAVVDSAIMNRLQNLTLNHRKQPQYDYHMFIDPNGPVMRGIAGTALSQQKDLVNALLLDYIAMTILLKHNV